METSSPTRGYPVDLDLVARHQKARALQRRRRAQARERLATRARLRG